MAVNPDTLRRAAEALWQELGSLDDFAPEVRNTIANIYYYKFQLVQANPTNPAAALNLKRWRYNLTLPGIYWGHGECALRLQDRPEACRGHARRSKPKRDDFRVSAAALCRHLQIPNSGRRQQVPHPARIGAPLSEGGGNF